MTLAIILGYFLVGFVVASIVAKETKGDDEVTFFVVIVCMWPIFIIGYLIHLWIAFLKKK